MANQNVSKDASYQTLTANRLDDGIVVYLGEGGTWTERLEEARIAASPEELKEMEAIAAMAVADQLVISVYPMAIAIEDGEPAPTSVRERIRALHRTTLTKDWYDVPL